MAAHSDKTVEQLVKRLAQLEQFIVTSEKCVRCDDLGEHNLVVLALRLTLVRAEHKKLLRQLTDAGLVLR